MSMKRPSIRNGTIGPRCANPGHPRQPGQWCAAVVVLTCLAACGGSALLGASSGSGGSGGSTSSSGSGSGSVGSGSPSAGSGGSSGAGAGCPPGPPAGPCSPEGQVCHYVVGGGQGQTDCGCSHGSWQCYSGCSPSTTPHNVNPSLCQPQLGSTTTCHPYGGTCGYTFEIPCWGDGGMPLSEVDAGPSQCASWCAAVAPPDAPSGVGCLFVNLVDGGADSGEVLVGQCSGCGV
jgi:hypothetical protein